MSASTSITAALLAAVCLAAGPLDAADAPVPSSSVRGWRVMPASGAPLSLAEMPIAAKTTATARTVPASIATLLASEVEGFDKSTLATVPLGTWACLSAPGTDVQTALAPLIAWRQRQGYHVVAATTDQIGGNDGYAIKAWLQQLYDTLAVPLDMVCLVGDADGAVAIDTWREPLSGLYGEGDHFYTQLDGDDVLGDVHIGRLSVTSASQLATVVGKLVAYESDPWLASDAGWFTRAGLVADVSESGWSTIYSSRWVKQHLLELNFTAIDTIFGGNYVTQQLASLNAGKSLYTYRGHWQMSGLTTGHIAQLSNGRKLPFVVTLTCDTGSFWTDTTCRSEAFLRAPNGGGVASIGTATTGTHTRYNDSMFQGIIDHVLLSGDPRLGPALSRGKLHMFANYGEVEPDAVAIWSVWNNLMGDPATPLWTAVPRELAVTAPTVLDPAADALPVTVKAGGQPVAGAIVCARVTGDPLALGVTGGDGRAVLPLAGLPAGTMQLTVTGPNLRPWLGSVQVGTHAAALRPLTALVDDDNAGLSRGDGDGIAEPGETVELTIPLRNDGTAMVPRVIAALRRSATPGVTVLRPTAYYMDIDPGQVAVGTIAFAVSLDASAAGGTVASLLLDVSSAEATGIAAGVVELPIAGPRASLAAVATAGATAAGGTPTLAIELANDGDRSTVAIEASLRSTDRWVSVTAGNASLPGAATGATTGSTPGAFALAIAPDCPAGHLAVLDLYLAFAEGGAARLEVPITCGTASAADPSGPDAWGYYAFDDLDAGYAAAPLYDWVEIDPALGGAGTALALADTALYADGVAVIDLPFPFRYYGRTFTKVSVCSNGWFSFGATPVLYYRNWRIPTPGAADDMVAVFWDELRQAPGEGGVFTWHDAAQHRFVIEWSRLRNAYNDSLVTSPETFQAVLYDPAWRAGETGDGDILLQYHTVNQVDELNGYATVGIQDHERDDGVLYSYWNLAAPGAAPLQAGRAILFTTLVNRPDAPADAPQPAVLSTALASAAPNPFNPRTTIGFTLAAAGPVDLDVYDVQGRLVRRLVSGSLPAGAHGVVWQGDDVGGGAVASGTYFCRLRAGGQEFTRKLTLLR